MSEIFIKALERLTDPLAIISIVLLTGNIILVLAIVRYLSKISETLGKQAALLEYLVYQHDDNTAQSNESSR